VAGRGAKNLLLLSRSGPKNVQATDLLKALRGMGVQLEAPKCDVTSYDELSQMLLQYSEVIAPIKGCIQGTVVTQVDSPTPIVF
jgi:hypothetical protein